ncbi:type II toxin-antitoxin system RelE/ParE family toxin [Pantoea sp.]|uniref:type II toxin-antitoxin system RelE/ParE family toxin n=1 Tax=Pantoea sp. TaxID=69393 RepID=UPI00289D7B34|nr:type II toxin-antitoxin system RelE/ParE family toxin [Pantoea sp.]
MIFIKTPVFTEDVKELLTDDEYSEFQQHLADNPTAGDVIKQTGRLRKIRWALPGKGKVKRGGVRVIYYHVNAADQIRLILIYTKGIKDNLTPHEKKVLRSLNEKW